MAKTQGRTVDESKVEMVEVVLPNDANPLGYILGGKVMHLIDVAGAIAAHRHARSHVVTVSVDSLDFRHPIRVGQIILLRAFVNRTFHTSIEVEVNVYLEEYIEGTTRQTSSAFLTYVAVDSLGTPTPVPPLIPRTHAERLRYREALQRRRRRLALAARAHQRYFEKEPNEPE
jgi:acyl-CoA hydrolase